MGLGSGSKQVTRLLKILALIPKSPLKTTVSNIHQSLQHEGEAVDKKTVERDLKLIQESWALECDDTHGKPYGWSLPSFDIGKPTAMPNDVALAFGFVEQHLKNILPSSTLDKLQPYFRVSKDKLTAYHQKYGELAWSKKIRVIQIDPKRLLPEIKPEIQEEIYDALLNNRQLEVVYQARSKEYLSKYKIHLLGLVSRGGIFYVICHSDYNDRTFPLALHRFVSAKKSDLPNCIPAGFDLDTFLVQKGINYNVGDDIHLKARLTHQLAFNLEESPLGEAQSITSCDDGRFELEVNVLDTYDFRRWLISCGSDLEVVEPVALRNDLHAKMNEMLAIYES